MVRPTDRTLQQPEVDSNSEIDPLKYNGGENKMIRSLTLFALVLFCSGTSTSVGAQQISETYRKVNSSVVIVRVQQQTPSPDPQKGLVSLPSFGSGVLIAADGKILTAAHVVEAADQICVEFFDGQ